MRLVIHQERRCPPVILHISECIAPHCAPECGWCRQRCTCRPARLPTSSGAAARSAAAWKLRHHWRSAGQPVHPPHPACREPDACTGVCPFDLGMPCRRFRRFRSCCPTPRISYRPALHPPGTPEDPSAGNRRVTYNEHDGRLHGTGRGKHRSDCLLRLPRPFAQHSAGCDGQQDQTALGSQLRQSIKGRKHFKL